MNDTPYEKDFDGWTDLKKQTHARKNPPTFAEREIWWCSTGVNVGVEQDGKNIHFERPVLIVRKFNRRLFWGIPITTQERDAPHRYPLSYGFALLSQMRAYDSLRLLRRKGELSDAHFDDIRSRISQMALGK